MGFDKYEDIKLGNGLNITENKLYEAMKGIGLNPMPQYPISKMKVDFAFPEKKVVIEVNGVLHDTDEGIIRDKKRWFFLDKEGWKVKSFKAKEVNDNPQKIAREILELTGGESTTGKKAITLSDFEEEQKAIGKEIMSRLIMDRERRMAEERRIAKVRMGGTSVTAEAERAIVGAEKNYKKSRIAYLEESILLQEEHLKRLKSRANQ